MPSEVTYVLHGYVELAFLKGVSDFLSEVFGFADYPFVEELQIGAQAVAKHVLHEVCLAVDDPDGPFRAGRDTLAAAVAELFVDFDDIAVSFSCPLHCLLFSFCLVPGPPPLAGKGFRTGERQMVNRFLSEYRLQVLVGRRDRLDVEVLHQHVEHVRRHEGRKRRAEPDVLDPEGEQGEQDRHGLLLVPGEDHGQGQLVHAHAEGLREGHGDLDGRVGVVALAHVEKPRDAADVAQVLVEEAELPAGEGQDDAVLGHLLHELRVVVAARAWRRRIRRPGRSGGSACPSRPR